jgi:GYF domain 2
MKIYIKNDGQDSGPFSKDELQGKIYSGELSRTIWARLDGAEEWVPLESLLGGKPVPRISPETLSVTLEQLRDRKEKTALVWLYIASVPVWIFLICGRWRDWAIHCSSLGSSGCFMPLVNYGSRPI